MTRKEAKRASEIMLAYANGEKIECYRPEINKWLEVSNDCLFNWDTTNYRIKPKEKFDPKTLSPFDKVLVRDTNSQTWCCNLFSNIDNRGEHPYICMSSAYNMVIPYDENTEHLVGTADDVPDYYRYEEVKYASKDYVNYLLDKQEYHNEKYTEYDIKQAFEKGAEWADNHPINVWHDASEVPNENTSIVFIWYGNLIHKLEIIPNVDNSFYSWLTANRYIKQWAYIDDILPKGGEE